MIVPVGSSLFITGGSLFAAQNLAVAGSGGTSFTLTSGTAVASEVAIGSGSSVTNANQSGGFLFANGGNLSLANGGSASAVYNLSGGQIQVAGEFIVGSTGGTAVVNQSGGSVNATELDLGVAFGHGTYSLSAGTLSTSLIVVGYDNSPSSGVFTQTGGTNTTNQLVIATAAATLGTYNLINGTLNITGPLFINVTNGGIINQTGGTFNLNGSLYLGESTSTARQTLAGGTLNVTTDERIAYGSDAVFTQTGGVHNSFDIGVGYFGATGIFNLTGGTLNNTAQIIIGSSGGGIGVMNQSGGAATTSNLYVGVDTSTGSYNLSGGTLAVGSNLYIGLVPGSTGTYNVMGGSLAGSTVYIGGDGTGPQGVGTFNISSGTASFSGNVTLWNSPGSFLSMTGGTLAANSINLNAPATLAGVVTAQSLSINASTTKLGANNTLGAGIAVTIADAATLDLGGHGQRIGALSGGGAISLGGASLTAGSDTMASFYYGSMTSAVPNTNGSFTKVGIASLDLKGLNSYQGGTTVAGGTLFLDQAQTLPTGSAVTIQAGADLNTNGFLQTVAGLSGGGVLSIPSGTFTVAGPSTFAGLVEGAGVLSFNGPGTLALTGANTYSGPTLINGGIVSVTSPNNLGVGGKLNLNGGTFQGAASFDSSGQVILNSSGAIDVTIGNTVTASGVISGAAALSKTGPGVLVLNAANSFSLSLNVAGGTVSVSSDGNLGAPAAGVSVQNGATLQATGSFSSPRNISIGAGAGNFDVTGGNAVTLAGMISGGALVKTDLGTLVLGGVGNYAGPTSVAAGTLVLSSAAAFPAGKDVNVAAGATMDIGTNSITFGGIFGAGTVRLGPSANLILNPAASETFAGNFTGGGSLVLGSNVTLTLSGVSDYSGATSIAAGTLALAANNALPSNTSLGFGTSAGLLLNGVNQTLDSLSGGGSISGAAGISTLTLNTQSAGGDYSGSITNNVAIVKTGPGTQTFSGSISSSSPLNVSGGSVVISGSNNSSAGVNLYTGGTLSVAALTNIGVPGTTVNFFRWNALDHRLIYRNLSPGLQCPRRNPRHRRRHDDDAQQQRYRRHRRAGHQDRPGHAANHSARGTHRAHRSPPGNAPTLRQRFARVIIDYG